MKVIKETVILYSLPILLNIECAYSNIEVEEVFIISTKISAAITDVPLGISDISSETIERFHISGLEDIRKYTTNLQFTETGSSTRVRIRGIGSGNDKVMAQSC